MAPQSNTPGSLDNKFVSGNGTIAQTADEVTFDKRKDSFGHWHIVSNNLSNAASADYYIKSNNCAYLEWIGSPIGNPHGVGSVMLSLVCNEARKQGAKRIEGSIRPSQLQSNGKDKILHFYEKNGFGVTQIGPYEYRISKDLN